MESVRGALSATIEITSGPPPRPHSYLFVARRLMQGVSVLACEDPPPSVALAFLSAHVLECLLKAFLSRDGSDKELRKREVRHNLEALWAMAHERGLPISSAAPEWASVLSGLHNHPYYLRYAIDINALVLPSAEPMRSELAQLLRIVQEQIKEPSHA